jgi:hypothetical protein
MCAHCAHIPASQLGKGSVYYPSLTMGIYQASQNMCSTHLQCRLCPEMPESTKTTFAELGGRNGGAVLDKWACTEQCIFAVGTIPQGIEPIETLHQD